LQGIQQLTWIDLSATPQESILEFLYEPY
jgi:hypothetical protein